MRALNQKLLRDLWQLRGQATAIALVIACGVATYVMFLSTLESLKVTRSDFYRQYRFADVFAPLKRAPLTLTRRIAVIPGVDRVGARVVAPVTLDIAGFDEPVTGLITSIPDGGQAPLNKLYIKAGRTVALGRDDEVVVSEAFAAAHRLRPGDGLDVLVKGRRLRLTIVGTAISPEFVHQLRPGGVFPDFKRYAVMWMARTPLAAAYDMEGAFNNVALSLARGADAQGVIDRLDVLLRPYGGVGAYLRKDQLSNRFLSEELKQLENVASIFPVIFLAVSAFLLNVVITRLVGTQREQIATLKAFGYTNVDVALYYMKLVMIIVVLAAALGVGVGAWLAHVLAGIYTHFFRLPYLEFRLAPAVVGGAVLVSAAAGVSGTVVAVWRAVRLRPAEGMRPEPPAKYRETLMERMGLRRMLSAPGRMILRHLGHRPLKSLFSVVGIALAGAILMTGRFQEDTVGFMMYVQYVLSQRQDLTVTFVEPTSYKALYELRSLPGVTDAEPFRTVPVRLRHGHYDYRTGIEGVSPGGELYRLLDTRLNTVPLPPEGLVMTDYLGHILHVQPGDRVTVEVLEGSQPVRQVPVVALVKQYLGLSGYMNLDAMNRLLQEGHALSGAYLAVDGRALPRIYDALKGRPRVLSVTERTQEIRNFKKTLHETMLFWTTVAAAFSAVIAFGVIYNAARITLTERSRELASLRVLGYTRGEISYILLGELAVLTLVAIPFGLIIGRWLCGYIAHSIQSDLYRVPLILEPKTYAFSALVVLLSSGASALLVRRHLDDLDLIGVLKTAE